VKIFQASDLHFSPNHLDEANRCFGFALARAIERNTSVGILSGDTFDHRVDLHHPCVAAVLGHVRNMADHMPALVLQGTNTHDTPGALNVFKTIGGKYPVFVADRICQVALCQVSDGIEWIPSDGWQFDILPAKTMALFACLPSINKGAVAAACGVEDAAQKAGEYVSVLLSAWAAGHVQARRAGIPVVLVSHGTVSGSVTEQGVPMAGLDHEFTTGSLFSAQATATMLGHIHQHQEWENEGRRIAYPGSAGRLHFGELTDKGVLFWDLSADAADTEFVATPAKRLLQFEYEGPPDMDELASCAQHAEGAHVRVRYSIDIEHRHSVDRKEIERMYLDAGAAVCRVQPNITQIQRSRAEGMTKAVDHTDRLAVWGRVTDTDTAPLVDRLMLLQAKEPDQVVNQVAGEVK